MRNTTKNTEPTSNDYVSRVNRAIDFILGHIDQPLNLEIVAKAACFSPFHFHRIFRSLVGESLNEFVKRVRLERALKLLTQQSWSNSRGQTLTEIAFACGFASSSDFSRCFRQKFGVPPSEFDVESFRHQRRNEWQECVTEPGDRHLLEGLPAGSNPDGFEVSIRELPPRCVAYIRVPDPYQPDAVELAAKRLVEWAEEQGLADGQWLGYMWDDPEVVDHRKCRYDVGLVVPDVKPKGEIGRFDFPRMRVAEVELRGGIDLEMRCLDWLFKTWLPSSGYYPCDHPNFEAWIGRPFAHGNSYFELLAQIPIV